MKKISKLLALLMFAVITFASCDSNKKASDKDKDNDKKEKTSSEATKLQSSASLSSLEADALKIASLYCSYQKSIASGDTVLMMQLDKEGESFSNSVFEKYTNEADQKKIQDIIKTQIEKCK